MALQGIKSGLTRPNKVLMWLLTLRDVKTVGRRMKRKLDLVLNAMTWFISYIAEGIGSI